MGINHIEKLNKRKIYLINFISLFFGFGLAISSYITGFYFKEAAHTDNISNFYLASYFIFLVLVLNLHKIIKFSGKSMSLYFFLFIKTLSITLILFINPSLLGALSLITYIVFGNLAWLALNIILETYSVDKMSGRIRGLFLTISNTGFLFGPYLSMDLFSNFSFNGVFTAVLIIDVLILFISIFTLNEAKNDYNKTLTIIQLLNKAKKRKNIMRIYYISIVLNFFYATMVIYSPIYLYNLGLSYTDIGKVFTIMLLPFVLFQYIVGRIADKKIGEKEMIIFALMIMSLSTLSIYFIESTNLIIWATVLFITRIGASFIEVLKDSYFFKRIDGEDIELIDFFRTAKPVAYASFALVSGVLLDFLEIKTMFILLSLVIIAGLYPALRLDDSLGEDELLKLK